MPIFVIKNFMKKQLYEFIGINLITKKEKIFYVSHIHREAALQKLTDDNIGWVFIF